MTEFIDYIRNRRSNRKYDSQSVSKEKLGLILEAGLRSPTGNNFGETEFILIEDKETLLYLSRLRKVATLMLNSAGAAIVVIADREKAICGLRMLLLPWDICILQQVH